MPQFIEQFLEHVNDYRDFIENGNRKLTKADADFNAIAELSRVGQHLQYTLTATETGMMVGDLVKVFEPSDENVALFNRGSKRIAELLKESVAVGNTEHVDHEEQPFGPLTYVPEPSNYPVSETRKKFADLLGVDLPIAGGDGKTATDPVIILQEAGSNYVAIEYQ